MPPRGDRSAFWSTGRPIWPLSAMWGRPKKRSISWGRLTPDVVIMDLMLPGMNGVDATRHILVQRPETRVLALSNHCGTALVRVVLDAGCIGYVRKDAAAEELLPAIRSVAVGTQYVGTLLKDPSPKWRTV